LISRKAGLKIRLKQSLRTLRDLRGLVVL